ncbi:hypothetical protein [Streptomyces sp. NPDC005093]
MSTRRGPVIRDRRAALLVGYGGIVIGALALWDAYELRGKRRPFLTKFLPGA